MRLISKPSNLLPVSHKDSKIITCIFLYQTLLILLFFLFSLFIYLFERNVREGEHVRVTAAVIFLH